MLKVSDYNEIRCLLETYLQMYASRDDRLTSWFSENFSGFTGSGDFLVKDRDAWVAITRQDFAQVKEPVRMELKDLSIQCLSDTVAVTTALVTIHLPIKEYVLSRKPARLALIFRKESGGWKISHCSYSLSYGMARDGEIYPLQELEERNRILQEQIAEQTAQLCETNSKLQRTNKDLERIIVEQKQTEEALRESESKYRLLTENASDVVWRLDSEYRFTYVSPADERLRGYKADEVIGHHVFEMFNEEGIATIKKMAQLRQESEQLGTPTGTITFEAEHRCKDGRWLWAEIRYSAERDTDGKATGFYGITREITERKLAEDASRRAKAAAEEASKAKSQFLATMSHEIRTPLNALVGFSSLARKATDPDTINQYLVILEQSSRSLMDLVNNILDMSKIEAGHLEFEAVPFELRQFTAMLEEQYVQLARQKMLELRVFVADNLPAWVLGDPLRLRQILANLLSNAVKFTESGEVTCTISCVENTEKQIVRFEVKDSGIGIPESFLPLLFQPFRQLDPTISRKFGGTGLGLAIVHSLVDMMKGTIAVDSREGAGSRFVVDLPLPETDPLPEELFATPIKLASCAVLVVEDNSFNRQLLGDILTSWGHWVTLAEDGHQALSLTEKQLFDFILLDIRMPGIDGIEVARRVRQREQERSETAVPILAITADADNATREACHTAGINAVLSKPLVPEQLARVLAQQCEGIRAASPEHEPLFNQEALKGLSNNPERIHSFRAMLLRDIDKELRCLHTSLDQGDRKELVRAAHTLKGLYGYMTNRQPVELADWIQQNAPSAAPEELQRVVEQLGRIYSKDIG